MTHTRPIVVFDFDGVICDSIHDSLLTAVNTYLQCVPDNALPVNAPLDSQSVFRFEETHPRLFQQFSKLMPVGNFAQDYFVVLNLIENKQAGSITDQDSFNRYKKNIPDATLIDFQKRFYMIRSEMQQTNPEAWSELLKPFPGIVDSIRSLSRRVTCVIATSKDSSSVNILLERYGLSSLFLPDNILDKDFSKTKRSHIIWFHENNGIPFNMMHFIDDKVSHLLSVTDLGVNTYLAVWGFNSEHEHTIAVQHGISLLQLKDLATIGT